MTINDARFAAQAIKDRAAGVLGVELFGSVARSGKGHDFDLILIVDDATAEKFWATAGDLNPRIPASRLWVRRFVKKYLRVFDTIFTYKIKRLRRQRVRSEEH